MEFYELKKYIYIFKASYSVFILSSIDFETFWFKVRNSIWKHFPFNFKPYVLLKETQYIHFWFICIKSLKCCFI